MAQPLSAASISKEKPPTVLASVQIREPELDLLCEWQELAPFELQCANCRFDDQDAYAVQGVA